MPTLPRPRPRRIAYTESLVALLDESGGELHRLSAAAQLVPDPRLIGAAAVRWSALTAGRLEDDPTDLLDMLRLEAGDAEGLDAGQRAAARRAVARADALRTGLELVGGGAAFDDGLLVAVRDRLGEGGNGGDGAPAGPDAVPIRLTRLYRLLDDRSLPVLVRVALAQRRLGAPTRRAGRDRRLGPLLLPLALAANGVAAATLLRVPFRFAEHGDEYRSALAGADPEPWVRFFLQGVRAQAADDGRWVARVRRLLVDTRDLLWRGRASPTAIAAAEHLVARPYVSARTLADDLGVSLPTARAAIDHLVAHGHLVETTRRRRGRFYAAPAVLADVYGRTDPVTRDG